MSKLRFSKPPLSIDEQVALLVKRGLNVPDKAKAAHYLNFIGYYRLSGYWRYFADPTDAARERFRADTNFDQILDPYIFDRKLRALLMDAFERIEVAAKATISQEACTAHGAFWLDEPKNFDHESHADLKKAILEAVGARDAKPQHLFIGHFYNKYSDDVPPSWMVVETISFGLASRIYKNSRGELQTKVANQFGLHRTVMQSWLHALAFGRNVCAHNCRVWNRTFTIKPKIPRKYEKEWPEASHDRLYILCCIIQELMTVIADGSDWHTRLRELIASRGALPLRSMGFPDDWEAAATWGFQKLV